MGSNPARESATGRVRWLSGRTRLTDLLINVSVNYDAASMVTPACNLDVVFSALADGKRRAIVERLLTAGELSASEIARPFRISSPAISRHLRVLEEAGIIERRVDRQWRYVRIQTKALTFAKSWLAEITGPQRRSRAEVPAVDATIADAERITSP